MKTKVQQEGVKQTFKQTFQQQIRRTRSATRQSIFSPRDLQFADIHHGALDNQRISQRQRSIQNSARTHRSERAEAQGTSRLNNEQRRCRFDIQSVIRQPIWIYVIILLVFVGVIIGVLSFSRVMREINPVSLQLNSNNLLQKRHYSNRVGH